MAWRKIEPHQVPSILTRSSFDHALLFLSAADPDLDQILQELGPPPMWEREPGFPTLVHIILEQQVSLASARAAYDRLLAAASSLTPERLLEFDDQMLKAIGFSRQKTGYVRHLAASIIEGHLDLDALVLMEDADVHAELVKIKGIGDWTADIYLLMALRRADIWPRGDLALAAAAQRVKQLPARPTSSSLATISAPWQPWRAVAARILWHFYLSDMAQRTPKNNS